MEGPVQNTYAVAEPVVPVAERFDPILPGQGSLRFPRLRHAQVVEAQIGREVGLVMPPEQRLGLRHVGPFCEPLAPPPVVLRDGMKLR
jgi:hypothetical protein